MSTVLHLSAWDGYTPVMLPYGAKTMDGIMAASNGVLVPFIIFVLFLFRFMYNHQWIQEYNKLAGMSQSQFPPESSMLLQPRRVDPPGQMSSIAQWGPDDRVPQRPWQYWIS